jgi:hypothetical protein
MDDKFTPNLTRLLISSDPEFNLMKQMRYSWIFHVGDRSVLSRNFYDHWQSVNISLKKIGITINLITRWSPGIQTTDTITMKDRDTCILSPIESLIQVYFRANEPEKHKCLDMNILGLLKILDSEYKQASTCLDDIIKACENLHLEEQDQLK